MLGLYHHRERTWPEEEVALVQAFADQAAVAIQNARLYRSVADQAARMRSIQDLSARLNRLTDVRAIAEAIVAEASAAGRLPRHSHLPGRLGRRHVRPDRLHARDARRRSGRRPRPSCGSRSARASPAGWPRTASRCSSTTRSTTSAARRSTAPTTCPSRCSSCRCCTRAARSASSCSASSASTGSPNDDLQTMSIFAGYAAQAMANATSYGQLARAVGGARAPGRLAAPPARDQRAPAVDARPGRRARDDRGRAARRRGLRQPVDLPHRPRAARDAAGADPREPRRRGEPLRDPLRQRAHGLGASSTCSRSSPTTRSAIRARFRSPAPRTTPRPSSSCRSSPTARCSAPSTSRASAAPRCTSAPATSSSSSSSPAQASIALRNADAHHAVSQLRRHRCAHRARQPRRLPARPRASASRRAEAARRPEDHGFSVLMMDLDRFKAYNDRHGHPAGDALLHRAANAIYGAARSDDRVYRYGGDEFVLILPDTDVRQAARVGDRVRRAVAALTDGEPAPVTITVGVAGLPGRRHDSRRADRRGRHGALLRQALRGRTASSAPIALTAGRGRPARHARGARLGRAPRGRRRARRRAPRRARHAGWRHAADDEAGTRLVRDALLTIVALGRVRAGPPAVATSIGSVGWPSRSPSGSDRRRRGALHRARRAAPDPRRRAASPSWRRYPRLPSVATR